MKRIARICGGFAVIFALLGSLPRSWVQPLGPLIGRPNAVTVETHFRALVVCWFLAGTCAAVAAFIRCRPSALTEAWRGWREECRRYRLPSDPGWWFVVAMTAVGAAIRGVHLNTPMAYDEAYTFLNYARKSWLEGVADYDSTNNHLLNTWIMHWLWLVGGPREAVLRLGVFVAGALLIPATYAWARTWTERPAAMLTTALVAVAPALVTYSFDARGYSYVALAAVCLDLACRRLLAGTETPRHWTAFGMIAVVLGLWAMPIMLYAVLGSCVPYVGRRWAEGDNRRSLLAAWLKNAAIVLWLVFALYMPAFVFRGLRFLHDPILRPTENQNYVVAALESWRGAWRWWTAGVVPAEVWGVGVVLGVAAWAMSRRHAADGIAPFLAVAAINCLRQSAPPPRIYLFLLPWAALSAAYGYSALIRRLRGPSGIVSLLAGGVLAAGAAHAVRTPVLIFPEERAQFLDVPALVAAVHDDLSGHRGISGRLLAPLPVDYPTRFYLERQKSLVPMNGRPRAGELVYAAVVTGRPVSDTLHRPPVELNEWNPDADDWIVVPVAKSGRYTGTLTLYRTRSALSEASAPP